MMNLEKLKKEIDECNYYNSIPIEEFASIEELNQFVRYFPDKDYTIKMYLEQSNFHQGVLVSVKKK